jgi:hypothetical protein
MSSSVSAIQDFGAIFLDLAPFFFTSDRVPVEPGRREKGAEAVD